MDFETLTDSNVNWWDKTGCNENASFVVYRSAEMAVAYWSARSNSGTERFQTTRIEKHKLTDKKTVEIKLNFN